MSGFFRRPYTIRRRGKQDFVNGYTVSTGKDFVTRLNIQPFSKDDLITLPEGERTVRRIKSYGSCELIAADEQRGIQGDLLYYDGKWYECTTCVHWLHTPLAHYESEFVLISDQSKHKPPDSGGDTVDDKQDSEHSV